VTAENNRLFQDAPGDGVADCGMHVIALDACDRSRPDMVKNRLVTGHDSRRIDGQTAKPLPGAFSQDQVLHPVTLPEMMVKGKGHAVLQA
jgi:hypothetical protein